MKATDNQDDDYINFDEWEHYIRLEQKLTHIWHDRELDKWNDKED